MYTDESTARGLQVLVLKGKRVADNDETLLEDVGVTIERDAAHVVIYLDLVKRPEWYPKPPTPVDASVAERLHSECTKALNGQKSELRIKPGMGGDSNGCCTMQ